MGGLGGSLVSGLNCVESIEILLERIFSQVQTKEMFYKIDKQCLTCFLYGNILPVPHCEKGEKDNELIQKILLAFGWKQKQIIF